MPSSTVTEPANKLDEISHLTEAFQQFTQRTAHLERGYAELKQRFASVNQELEQTNRKLNDKVEELAETTEYLNSVLGHMRQGLLFVSVNGTVTTCNAAAEKILGIKSQEVMNSSFAEHFSDELLGFSMTEALKKKRVPPQTEVTLCSGNQLPRYLEVTTTFALDHHTEAQGILLLLRDITEIRGLELIANRNDRMKELGEMAASVAHEIRNPLGGIKGFAALLVRDLEEGSEDKRMAQYIVDGTEALNRLVTNILHYSRPLQMQVQSQLIAPLLDQVTELVRVDSNLNQKVTLKKVIKHDHLQAAIDAEMMKGALLNLAVNAIQAMESKGTLELLLDYDEGDAIIQVSDTGSGIAPKNLEKIFSPFFTTKSEGNGFGLSEVHRVIQAHSGQIEVDSELGKGTTFTIRLPIGGAS